MGCHHRKGGYGQLNFTASETVALFLGLEPGRMVYMERGVGEDTGYMRFRACKPGEDGFVIGPPKNCGSGSVHWRTSSRFLAVEEGHRASKLPDVEPQVIDSVRWVVCKLHPWATKEVYRIWHPTGCEKEVQRGKE
jgi:hypothetical protein